MKVAIFSTIEPFVKGGAKKQFENLQNYLINHFNIPTELFFIPFSTNIEKLDEQVESIRKLNIKADILITSRPMSYAIKHNHKIVWFMHHISFFYEFSNTKLNPYLNYPNFEIIKSKFIEQDTYLLNESKKIFSVSNFVASKLEKFNNIKAETIYPFLNDIDKYYNSEYSDYFFLPSLITYTKRQHLIIEALLYTKNPVKLILAGQIDQKYFKKYISPLIKNKKIKNNLKIIDKFLTDEKYDLYSKCLAVIFTPINEAFGYVVLESFFSSKPVITTIDSGGPTELVENKINGFIIENNPKKIAEIMDELYENRKLAQELGKNALDLAQTKFGTQKIKESIKKLIT